jgi:D-lactate dehydrogenase (cytochrome)
MRRVDGWTTIQEEYNPFLLDESRLGPEPVEHLYFPETTAEAARAVEECAETGTRIVFSGGRTGITGGAVPRGAGAIISTERLRLEPEVRLNPETGSWTLRVGAGMTLAELKDILARKAYRAPERAQGKTFFFPVDPTETGAAVGGMAATNASGARTLLYGPMRDWVSGLTVVLADGSVTRARRENGPGAETPEEPSGAWTGTEAASGSSVRLPLEQETSRGSGKPGGVRETDSAAEWKGSSGASGGSEDEVRYREVPVKQVKIPEGKHSGGYYLRPPFDAVDLFVGSEGTLGLITELDLKLIEVPPGSSTLYLMIFLPEDLPFELTAALKGAESFSAAALEYMDHRSLSLLEDFRRELGEASGVPEMPEGTAGILYVEVGLEKREDFHRIRREIAAVMAAIGIPEDRTWAGFSDKTLEAMKKLRHALPERINTVIAGRKARFPELTKIGTDLAVPDRRLEEMTLYSIDRIEEEGLEFCAFGHIGNGHLHINILPRDAAEIERAWGGYRELAERAVELGGSVSAEHGIGRIKRKFFELQFSADDREAMRRVKEALDPVGLLNPGVLW